MATRRATISELADTFHLARSVVLKLLTEAGVKRSPDRTFPFPQAAAAIRARKSLEVTIGNRVAGRAGGKLTALDLGAEDVDPFEGLDVGPKTPALADDAAAIREAKTALAEQQVRKLRLANDANEGRLIERERAARSFAAVAMKARVAFSALGARCAPLVMGLDDADEIARIIGKEARATLGELADDATLLRRVLP